LNEASKAKSVPTSSQKTAEPKKSSTGMRVDSSIRARSALSISGVVVEGWAGVGLMI
jgi:hypothetical protein